MKSWLKRLIHQLTEKQDGLVLLRLSLQSPNKLEPQTSRSNTIPVCPLCGVVPINWTVHNKWCHFATETKSTETVLVGTNDGAVRVPLDRATHPQEGYPGEMKRTVQDDHPSQTVPEIRCTNCDAAGTHLAGPVDVGPCCRGPFWTVPYELIWRSLPHGEDR